ncbi:MAG: tol-pal system-associated acyl-CoA thioesterase [Ruminobacter sp.]|jgi:acyl-CoA thioester hydrolase|uniref:tol-pal system-associated acyl-CoA thioesterase n=1 Tax=Ruminobacter sp. TaxID=2774296 RepID=UPI00257D046B|nr:tol-pal system-associated acyl-CoA thioesterase [Ruminobacter sp.]MBQ3775888.1 tol-pal system-associated acyl-CoA thioesterase [Ruminobacter sp.]
MSDKFFFSVRVYYEDTDAGGVVYNANYVKFLERARTEWLRAHGVKQSELLEKGFGFVVASMQVDFRRSAKLDDLLLVSSTIKEVKSASAVFAQEITDEEGNVYIRAVTKIACVDVNRKRPSVIPQDIKEVFLSECD